MSTTNKPQSIAITDHQLYKKEFLKRILKLSISCRKKNFVGGAGENEIKSSFELLNIKSCQSILQMKASGIV